MKPFAWFTPTVSDAAYAPVFRSALELLLPTSYFRKPESIQEGDWEAWLRWGIDQLHKHLTAFELAHNHLVDVKPRRQLFGLHKALVKAAKGYAYTMLDYTLMNQAILDGDPAGHSHHKKHGVQWDAITSGYARDLITKLERLLRSDPMTFELLIGTREVPQNISDCADGRSVQIFGGAIANWTP